MQLAELQNFVSSLLSQGVNLRVNGDMLKFEGDSSVLIEEVIDKIKKNKEAILNLIKNDVEEKEDQAPKSEPKAKAKKKVVRRNALRLDSETFSRELENGCKVSEAVNQNQEAEPEIFLEAMVADLDNRELNKLTSIQYVGSIIENSTKLGDEESIVQTPTPEELPQAYLNGKNKNLTASCDHDFYSITEDGTVRTCVKCRLIERRVQYAEPRF